MTFLSAMACCNPIERQLLDDEYRRRLHAIGLPAEQVALLMSQLQAMNAALDVGCCPQCGSRIGTKTRNEDAGRGSAWFGYACSCGWQGTRIEPET